MRWMYSAALAVPFVLSIPASAGGPVEVVTESAWLDFTGLEFPVPCIAGGAGENVVLDGSVHLLFHYTLPSNGAGNLIESYNFAGVVAIGQTTGIVYRTTESYRFLTTFQPGDVPRTDTQVTNVHFISPGQAGNFTAHTLIHTTIDADGDLTASVDHEHTNCD